MNTSRQIQLDAMREATRLRRDLNLADDVPAEPFQAIRDLGLWLVFNELSDLLGATFREGVGGIMLNPLRPVGMQRFTAAHELGHWRMHEDQQVTWDTDTDVTSSPVRVEREAQAFAAAFLMPRRLVARSLREAGVGANDPITPEQTYTISRNIGVSYGALAHQLAAIGRISDRARDLLLKRRVRDIKIGLGGTGTSESGSHIWPVDRQDVDTSQHLLEGDELALAIPEAPATGYRWNFDASTGPLEVVSDHLERATDGSVGGTLTRRVVFRAVSDGSADVIAEMTRPFEPEPRPIDRFAIRADVSLTPPRQNAALFAASPRAAR